jgi:predicted transcriptional regulator
MAAVIRSQRSESKVKAKGYRTHYDCVYDALLYLKNQPIPLTKYRISTNKHTLTSLLSNQFIKPVTNKKFILNSEYTDVPHYTISPKGIEYIKRYESLKQLFTD